MSCYIIAITDIHGIREALVIEAKNDKVTIYIRSNVKTLHDPFIEFIIENNLFRLR